MTIEKSAEKVQGMLGLLNHSLSMFEKDFAQIKDKCAAETALVKATFTTDVDALIEGHKKRLAALGADDSGYRELLKRTTGEKLEEFSKELESRLEKKLEQETLEKLFRTHEKKLTRLVFKSLLRYIFSFGRR